MPTETARRKPNRRSLSDAFNSASRFAAKLPRAGLWFGLKALRRLGLAPKTGFALDYIAYLRRVQHVRESGDRQNPDNLGGVFLTPFETLLARLEDLEKIRAIPLYHYMLARTRHYDRVLADAIAAGVKQLLFVGVGADARAFRFRSALDGAGVRVIETDLEPWLSARVRRCRRLEAPRDFHHRELNLEKTDLAAWTGSPPFDRAEKTLIVAEGVTPYVSAAAHGALLRLAGEYAPRGSLIAYDAKFEGTGESSRFRMPRDPARIAALHESAGLELVETVSSAEAQTRLASYEAPVFGEDILLTAVVR